MDNWRLWSLEDNLEEGKFYRWRVSPRRILGLDNIQPEWSAKFSHTTCTDIPFPPGSYWTGWKAIYEPTLEWRECTEQEADKHAPIQWNGLNLLPSPFTGEIPEIKCWSRVPYKPDKVELYTYMIRNGSYWEDLSHLQKCWNTRV